MAKGYEEKHAAPRQLPDKLGEMSVSNRFRSISPIARMIRPTITVCFAAAIVTGVVVVSQHLTTTSTPAQPLGCQRSLTPAEIQTLQGLGIQVITYQGAASVNEQDVFAMGSAQLASDAPSKATAIACQLIVLNAPNISPPATHFAPIKGQVAWVVMYQGLGPGSHGQSASTGARDLYMFFDANSGTYLFSISGLQQ